MDSKRCLPDPHYVAFVEGLTQSIEFLRRTRTDLPGLAEENLDDEMWTAGLHPGQEVLSQSLSVGSADLLVKHYIVDVEGCRSCPRDVWASVKLIRGLRFLCSTPSPYVEIKVLR